MLLRLRNIFLLSALLATAAACTQEQAPVEDRGKQFYGREHEGTLGASNSETYSKNSPRYKKDYTHAVEPASVPAVGVSDLPSPSGVKSSGAHNDSDASAAAYPSSSPFQATPSKPLGPAETKNTAQPSNNDETSSGEDKISDKEGITLVWPVTGGKIVSHFKGTANDGINVSLSEGEPIVAAASGTAVYAGNDLKDYGNMIILRHDNAWMTAYANASKIAVKKGAYVKQGDIIAYVGSTGGVKTPQLHFALRKGKVPVDPEKYLPKN